MAKKNRSPIVGIIFTLVGLAGLGVGGWLTYNTMEFMDNSVVTMGTVTDVEVNYDDDGTTYRPTFRYLDESDNKHRTQTAWSSSSYNFDVGERVEIIYDRREPEKMRVNGWFSIWGIGAIAAGVGATFLLVGGAARRGRGKAVRKVKRVEHEIRSSREYAKQPSRESEENHARETNFEPTVRRRD